MLTNRAHMKSEGNADEPTNQEFQTIRRRKCGVGEGCHSRRPKRLGEDDGSSSIRSMGDWAPKWNEKRSGKATPEKRPGVTINRRDLLALPVPDANLLWRDLHVRDVRRINGKTETKNIRVDIIGSGVSSAAEWECGMEFDYANDESFYCRPLRRDQASTANRMIIPPEASKVRFAFLPPMSGLAASEARLDPGAVNVRIGEGRTAEVLRNLCYRVYSEDGPLWESLSKQMTTLFGVSLDDPIYVTERGEITMTYRERGISLDLSASGRGLQQTLLLLAHLYANPGTTLLLDEPDAHLEILRQRQTYHLLTDVAERQGCQIVAASHSEVFLNEAADRDVVIAFVGTPHRIDDRGSQVLKALKEIGFEQYYQAEQTGFVLYLEGATDLAVLRAFAQTLDHEASSVLDRPFVHYVENKPQRARDHFRGLREAKSDLVGIALFDRPEQNLGGGPGLMELMWRRREIENYLVREDVLLAYAESTPEELPEGPLFGQSRARTSEPNDA